MNEAEFYLWEKASRDTMDFKKIYVDVADDLVAGIVLSEIIYWNLPAKDGTSKLRIQREGKSWIAAARGDWWERARVTPKQVDRAIGILEKRGIILERVWRFAGNPTVHIHLNVDVLLQAVKEIQETGKWILPKGEEPNSPKVNIEIDETVKSLTETTTESTAENTTIAPAARVPELVLYPLPVETLHVPSASEVMRERTIKAMQSRTPPIMDKSGLNPLDLDKYPDDVKPIIGKTCQLWNLKPPREKGLVAFWIKAARELLDTCSEFGPELLEPIRAEYVEMMRNNGGMPKWTVNSPESLVKTAGGMAGRLRDSSSPSPAEPVEIISEDSFYDTGYRR